MYARTDCIRNMSLAHDKIEDANIGPLWANHFSKTGVDIGSKTLVLALVYIIEDKAQRRARLTAIGPPASRRTPPSQNSRRPALGDSQRGVEVGWQLFSVVTERAARAVLQLRAVICSARYDASSAPDAQRRKADFRL